MTGSKEMRPCVVIVGRPNVGKSTLFNRIVGARIAIVQEQPGVTRDRLSRAAEWEGVWFTLVDTGGLDPGRSEGIPAAVERQVRAAIDEADVVLLVIDARRPLTSNDLESVERVRSSGVPVILVANKVDSGKQDVELGVLYKLGFGDPVLVSAEHGLATDELLDRIVSAIPDGEAGEDEEAVVRVAVVGRPNVGKSSFVNALLERERLIVDDKPGTTRDAVEVSLGSESGRLVFVDTAGMRRRGKVIDQVERLSLGRASRSIRMSHVSVLVVDGGQGVTTQDAHIAQSISEAGRGCVVLITKWDLALEHLELNTAGARRDLVRDYEAAVRERMPLISFAPVHCCSSVTGKGVRDALQVIMEVAVQWRRRLAPALLNSLRDDIAAGPQPPASRGRRPLKLYCIRQVRVCPPTFTLEVNNTLLITAGYTRYVARKVRAVAGFSGAPLVFLPRRRGGGKGRRGGGKGRRQ